MKSSKNTYNKHNFMLLILLCISQIALGDDIQKAINTDYLRTPEAAAFKKYGEESVNEYTGTADISVPLYTIKNKEYEFLKPTNLLALISCEQKYWGYSHTLLLSHQ